MIPSVSQLFDRLLDGSQIGLMAGIFQHLCVLNDSVSVNDKRAAFVVDRYGTIQYAEVLENAGYQPDLTAVEQTVERLGD